MGHMTSWPTDPNPRYTVNFKRLDVPFPHLCSGPSKSGPRHSVFTSKYMTLSPFFIHASGNQENPMDVNRSN